MKTLGIDFGASYVDAVLFDGAKIISTRSIPRLRYTARFLEEFPAFDTLISTGSKPHQKMKYCNELECIGRGGLFLTGFKNAVITSCGTGTAIIWKNQVQKAIHLGGTGLGGGTLLGLGKLLLGIDNADKILQLAAQGQRTTIDLTIGDILGKGIGLLSKDATAANFGKVKDLNFKPEDLARSLVAMITETIAITSCLAALSIKEKNLVFSGRLSTNALVQKYLVEACRIYGLKPYFLPEASYVTALGAALST